MLLPLMTPVYTRSRFLSRVRIWLFAVFLAYLGTQNRDSTGCFKRIFEFFRPRRSAFRKKKFQNTLENFETHTPDLRRDILERIFFLFLRLDRPAAFRFLPMCLAETVLTAIMQYPWAALFHESILVGEEVSSPRARSCDVDMRPFECGGFLRLRNRSFRVDGYDFLSCVTAYPSTGSFDSRMQLVFKSWWHSFS